MPSNAGYQYVSGSLILTNGAESVPFPGPLRRNGAPDPALLEAFILQCQLTSQQPRMKAKDWNNLGYAYATLPKPRLEGAKDAFARARSLTREPKLLGIIEANLALVDKALPKPRLLGGDFLPLVIPLPDTRNGQSLYKNAPPRPKTSMTRGGKKSGSKGPRK